MVAVTPQMDTDERAEAIWRTVHEVAERAPGWVKEMVRGQAQQTAERIIANNERPTTGAPRE